MFSVKYILTFHEINILKKNIDKDNIGIVYIYISTDLTKMF